MEAAASASTTAENAAAAEAELRGRIDALLRREAVLSDRCGLSQRRKLGRERFAWASPIASRLTLAAARRRLRLTP